MLRSYRARAAGQIRFLRNLPLATQLALLIGAIVFLPAYLMLIFSELTGNLYLVDDGIGSLINLLLGTLMIPILLLYMLSAWLCFSYISSYVTISITAIASAIFGLPKASRVGRVFALSVILLVAAFPFLFHRPPSVAYFADWGYEVDQVITERSVVDGVLRGYHDLFDGSRCRYEVLGWDRENQLYYKAECTFSSGFWQFDPNISDAPTPLSSVPGPDELKQRPKVIDQFVMGYRSLDGRFLAAVAGGVYGPQDVVLLSASN